MYLYLLVSANTLGVFCQRNGKRQKMMVYGHTSKDQMKNTTIEVLNIKFGVSVPVWIKPSESPRKNFG